MKAVLKQKVLQISSQFSVPLGFKTWIPAGVYLPWRASMTKSMGFFTLAICCANPAFALQSAVAYDRFGVFEDIGGPAYSYRIVDAQGLRRLMLPGIYPNVKHKAGPKISSQELFQKSKVWTLPVEECLDFWGTLDVKRAVDPRFTEGVRQMYYAQCLERAGRIREAIYAYYAAAVHFPGEQDPNRYWPSYWPAYLGVQAMDAVHFLTVENPDMGLRYVGADLEVEAGFDEKQGNDILRIWPGHLTVVQTENVRPFAAELRKKEALYARGSPTGVGLVRYPNNQWELRVNGEPFVVKGVNYLPASVASMGNADPKLSLVSDVNSNGRPDLWETWLDGNGNDQKDPVEPVVSDFALMAMMGANAARMDGRLADAPTLEEAYGKHKLYFVLGHTLAAMSPDGNSGTPSSRIIYGDPKERAKLLSEIETMVETHKSKPYLLAWFLGDGNLSAMRAEAAAYYNFAEEAVQRIHVLDPDRPVILVGNDLAYLDLAAKLAPSADILGVNSYRGFHGFGRSFWRDIRETAGKPVLVTEYGTPAYGAGLSSAAMEEMQMLYHQRCWRDILNNLAGGIGQGNALGGFAFEWLDGWRRGLTLPGFNSEEHQAIPETAGPFLDGNHYPEWYGILSLGGGSQTPFIRQPRKVFWSYYRMWKPKRQEKEPE